MWGDDKVKYRDLMLKKKKMLRAAIHIIEYMQSTVSPNLSISQNSPTLHSGGSH